MPQPGSSGGGGGSGDGSSSGGASGSSDHGSTPPGGASGPWHSGGSIPGVACAPESNQELMPDQLARRVRRAERGGKRGDEQEPGADAAAFVAFDRLSNELDELFVGKDNPLLQLRQYQTPFEQLPIIPPERLLPALLAKVRKALPTRFRFVTHLTQLAIKHHLHPFMKLVHAYGQTAVAYPPSLPVGYRFSLRGSPLTVPWLRPPSRDGGMALLVVKAAETAATIRVDGMQFGYWVAQQALRELEDPASCRAMQAELTAVGVWDSAAALTDLRYSCHETCAYCLLDRVFDLEQAGEVEELRTAFARHAAGLVEQRPDLGGAWALAGHGHYRLGNYYKAQALALRGLPVADAARDGWNGAYLRQVLAGSIAMAGEAATPGKLRVGVLRRLIGEAGLLEHRYRAWAPSNNKNAGAEPGGAAVFFFTARGFDKERIDQLPNDAVAPLTLLPCMPSNLPCLDTMGRQMVKVLPPSAQPMLCGGCGKQIKEHPKRCSRCWGVPYHDQACQKKHWQAGHRQQCQDVSCGGLDWAAEAAAAEAGLAAWEEGEQALTPEQRRARLGLTQMKAVIEHREAAGLPLRNRDIAGAAIGQQCPIS